MTNKDIAAALLVAYTKRLSDDGKDTLKDHITAMAAAIGEVGTRAVNPADCLVIAGPDSMVYRSPIALAPYQRVYVVDGPHG